MIDLRESLQNMQATPEQLGERFRLALAGQPGSAGLSVSDEDLLAVVAAIEGYHRTPSAVTEAALRQVSDQQRARQPSEFRAVLFDAVRAMLDADPSLTEGWRAAFSAAEPFLLTGSPASPTTRTILARPDVTVQQDGLFLVVVFQNSQTGDQVLMHELGRLMDSILNENASRGVLLDLSNVQSVNTSFFRFCLHIDKRLGGDGRRVKLCGVHAAVQEVIELTKLNQHFEMVDDQVAARESLLRVE